MHALVLAEVIVAAAKLIADGLYGDIKFVGDAVHRTVGPAVFEGTQLVEGDCLCHDDYGL